MTQRQVDEAVEAARKLRVSRVDVLGFEFEMGLVAARAGRSPSAKGVSLALRYIPKDVFDKRAVEKDQVVFYDVAYVEVQPGERPQVTVKLTDFGVYYRQEDVDALAGDLKNGGTKVPSRADRSSRSPRTRTASSSATC